MGEGLKRARAAARATRTPVLADLHDQTPREVEHGPYNCAYCRMQAYTFVAENPREQAEAEGPPTDWYVTAPASPSGGRAGVFGPYPEDLAREKYGKLCEALGSECPPKLLRVVEDYAQGEEA
jgi:hypothetical protein